jgi:hypothetical protein
MPTSLTVRSMMGSGDRIDFLGLRIGAALLGTWAISLLLLSSVIYFGADTAAFDSFELIATF